MALIVELVREPLDTTAWVERVASADCGAILTFAGVVRDHHDGRGVLRLEYTAYEPMAVAKMNEIATTVRERWPVRHVAVVHRLGQLAIGETSIFIALSLAHRREGFEALRYVIDTFKEIVPIWKKEFFDDGEAKWVEGS